MVPLKKLIIADTSLEDFIFRGKNDFTGYWRWQLILNGAPLLIRHSIAFDRFAFVFHSVFIDEVSKISSKINLIYLYIYRQVEKFLVKRIVRNDAKIANFLFR